MGTVTFTRLYCGRNSCAFSQEYGWLSETTRCVPQQIKPLYGFSDKFIASQSACFCYYFSLCHKEQIPCATATTVLDGKRFLTNALHFLWSDWMFAQHWQSTIAWKYGRSSHAWLNIQQSHLCEIQQRKWDVVIRRVFTENVKIDVTPSAIHEHTRRTIEGELCNSL